MDSRIKVKPLFAPLTIALALAGCGKGQQSENVSVRSKVPATAAGQGGVTPMAQRVAVIGILNKRNGIVQNVTLRPGQSVRWKDVIVRLRACEATAPWEEEKLTGAFVQVDVRRPDKSWHRVFSGWLYKERPALNVVQHPIYDVWTKSCAMTFPEGGPGSVSAGSSESGAGTPRSSARKSPALPPPDVTPPAAPTTPSTAPDSNPR